MASYRGRRRAPARPKLAKDQQELDYGSIEIITADDFKEGAVAELTPPHAQGALATGTDSYTRSPSSYETLMPAALPLETEADQAAKGALQPQRAQLAPQSPARKKTPLPKAPSPVNEYARTASAEIRLAPVARQQTPVPAQQQLDRVAKPAAKPALNIPVAKPVGANNVDDTEITKIHARKQQAAAARNESSDDYGIEEVNVEEVNEVNVEEVNEVNVEDLVIEHVDQRAAVVATPVKPIFDRRHSDADGEACSAVAIPNLDQLDQLDQRQIETEELPILSDAVAPRRHSILLLPLVLILGICLGYAAATWQQYLPYYSAVIQGFLPTDAVATTSAELDEAAPNVNNAD